MIPHIAVTEYLGIDVLGKPQMVDQTNAVHILKTAACADNLTNSTVIEWRSVFELDVERKGAHELTFV